MAMVGSIQAQCFQENNGVVAIEAEDFASQEKTSKREWYVIGDGTSTPKPDPDGSHTSGASGGKYIEALPDTRVTHEDPVIRGENFTDNSGEVAVLNYKVNFKTTGKFFVWVRLYSSGSEDNGVHVGINDTWPESGERMQWCDGKKSWTWESKQRTATEHCGVERQIFINVPTVGEHTFQLSMREDGVEIDKIILSKAYTKPVGVGPSVSKGACPTGTGSTIPSVTNKSSIAVVADGNSPDPDDIGATAASLALIRALGEEKNLIYYAHSCDLDPFSGSKHTITPAQELDRQKLMQTSADGTADRWGGFDHITVYNVRTQETTAKNKLRDAINAATDAKPLAIILAGEPDIIYDAVAAAQADKRKFVTIVSHHVANEESADSPGKNISDLEVQFPAVKIDRIPDQNVLLKMPIDDWYWARDHKDTRIKWLWEQGKIAEQDPVVGFQSGQFDISDAGMVYYQLTGDKNPDVPKVKNLLNYFVNNNAPPQIDYTPPTGFTFAANGQDTVKINDGKTYDIAFGANGTFEYLRDQTSDVYCYPTSFAKDPLPGIVKKCYTKQVADVVDYTPPTGFTFAANGQDTVKINDGKAYDIAFGANGTFEYLREQTSDVYCYPSSFAKDPLPGIVKKCFIKALPNVAPVVSFNKPTTANVTITQGDVFYVDANINDANLSYAELFIDGVFLRKESVAPYQWGDFEGANNANELDTLSPGTYTIKVVATDKEGLTGEASFTLNVEAEAPTLLHSVDKVSNLAILADAGGFRVTTGALPAELKVTNIQGKVVFSESGVFANHFVPMKANGVYFIDIVQGDKRFTQKYVTVHK